jgi:transcriptional regulator with XRE-family HTH domain/tetratricopeptide (TPR) repeat protein
MDTLDGHTPLAELARLAADLDHAVAVAQAGQDPRSTPEYVAAAHVMQLAAARIDSLTVHPSASQKLADALKTIAESLRRHRRFVTQTNGVGTQAVADIYSPEIELQLAGLLARARVATVIRRVRSLKDLTLRQVADEVGATASFISQLEFGRTLPTVERAALLDEKLGTEAAHQTSLVAIVNELRTTRDEVRRDLPLIQRSGGVESSAVTNADRPIPAAAVDALQSWRGSWDFSDVQALSVIAWQPPMRQVVYALAQLPTPTRTKAMDFVRSLALLRPESSRRLGSEFDPEGILLSERELGDMASWSLVTLVLELRVQFNPFVEDASAERLSALHNELTRRGFDALKMVRGPVLRRTARLLVERLRVEVAQRTDEQRLPVVLQEWLADHAEESSSALGNRLWAYWASINPVDAQRHPAPPVDFNDGPPAVDSVTEWFVVRLTESSLRNWPRPALDFEIRVQNGGVEVSPPWSAAEDVREIPLADVTEELARRSRAADSVTDREIPSEFVAHNLLTSAYQAFMSGRLDEAEAFARAAVERYPTVARAYNHLGFVLMMRGRFDDALAQLDRAEQLDYDEHDILDFNRACAHAMLGHFDQALQGFREALSNPHVGGAVLALIDSTTLIAVEIPGPVEYVAAAALNAAWAAAHLGAKELGREYLRIASAGHNQAWVTHGILGQAPAGDVMARVSHRLAEMLAA